MKLWRREFGEMCLVIPACWARRRMIRVAAWRLSRVPARGRWGGPERRSPGRQLQRPGHPGREGQQCQLGALADHRDGPVPSVGPEVLDVDRAVF